MLDANKVIFLRIEILNNYKKLIIRIILKKYYNYLVKVFMSTEPIIIVLWS